MQEDCQISGILQSGNRLIELLGHESVLNSRKRKNDSEKNVTDTQSRGDSSKDAENKTQTMDYSQVFPYWDFFSLVLDLLWTSGLIIPSNSSKQKCLSHAYLTIVFWKLEVCFLASQVHRCREIMTQDLTFQSLTHT